MSATVKCLEHHDCQVTVNALGGTTHVMQAVKIPRSEYDELQRHLRDVESKLESYRAEMVRLSDKRVQDEARIAKLLKDVQDEHARERSQVSESLRAVDRALGTEGWATKHDAKSLASEVDRLRRLVTFLHESSLNLSDHYEKDVLALRATLVKATLALEADATMHKIDNADLAGLRADTSRYVHAQNQQIERILKRLREQHDNFWRSPEETFQAFNELERRFRKVEQAQIDLARHVEKRVG